jgi:DNA-binding HxlR family transcriptional regulator
MQQSECPVARSLAELGERWRLLVLRDALHGLRRFDEFEESLGIAPNILADRLSGLVADGMLEKRRYSERPPRYEYWPTDKARDLVPVLIALVDWGTRWLFPEGPTVELIDRSSGRPVEPVLVNAATGQPISSTTVRLRPGPAAGPEIQARTALIRARALRAPRAPEHR